MKKLTKEENRIYHEKIKKEIKDDINKQNKRINDEVKKEYEKNKNRVTIKNTVISNEKTTTRTYQ